MSTFSEKQIQPPPAMAFGVKAACRYLGGISPRQFWAVCKRFGVEKNVFGNWNREDIDAVRLKRRKP